MSGFSAKWLALREVADARARNQGLAEAFSARLFSRPQITVVDLGCGTGANLRATAPLLADNQSWTLVDHDSALLTAAAEKLEAWADEGERDGAVLKLQKANKCIAVTLRAADLARDIEGVLDAPVDLVTASALFDLASVDFIRRCVRLVTRQRAAFYTALTYNGIQRWTPRHPADNQLMSAFHRHQLSDKGFGPAAGPTAPAHLADQLRLSGYMVLEGDSPWQLGARDAALVRELVAGFAAAVAQTGKVDAKTLEKWSSVCRTGAEVGHTDTLAFPE